MAYRRVKGSGGIVDAGLNMTLANYYLSLQAIYHSTRTTGIGLAFDQHTYALNVIYNLQSGAVNTYFSGTIEFELRLRLFQ